MDMSSPNLYRNKVQVSAHRVNVRGGCGAGPAFDLAKVTPD
jgi:hypothetical protein